MSEPKRCYRCGRIAPSSKSMERRLKIQTGEDGWRDAEKRRVCVPRSIAVITGLGFKSVGPMYTDEVTVGTNPDVLCPACKEVDGE